MTKYEIILDWSDEDEAFMAEVPELPGCVADGPTRQEAPANAEIVISAWLEKAREPGRPVPGPKGARPFRLRQTEAEIALGGPLLRAEE
ncbi:MAG: type II toxin-antitoxin system HicB family antitoxin [Bryobacteraceae bacterium]